MRILLFGRNGQVGRELSRTLLPLGEVKALGRAEADLSDPDGLRQVLLAHAPHFIVNAAAYTAVDRAESDKGTACRINAEAVGVMARYAAENAAVLVHYSTDYVFDGEKAGAYEETDAPNPINAYGRTKLAGERAIQESGCTAFIFRTSWVYSAHGANFIRTILRLARERSAIDVVADQHGAPTSAELIADVTALAIFALRKGLIDPGIYHLTPGGGTTWHGLACRVVDRARSLQPGLALAPEGIRPIPSEAYASPARRPRNSLLDTKKLCRALDLYLPDWTVHVDRVIEQMAGRGTP
ncbi:MAG: dTDP-4-dehydrorhamnose reductase [Deltaproteobacteria bacterium]